MIGYVVLGRIALTLGDPIGPAEDIPRCLTGFQDFCEQNDWEAAYYQVLPDYLNSYQQRVTMRCASAARRSSTWQPSASPGVRKRTSAQKSNKMNKLGYRAQVLQPPHPPDL